MERKLCLTEERWMRVVVVFLLVSMASFFGCLIWYHNTPKEERDAKFFSVDSLRGFLMALALPSFLALILQGGVMVL